MTATGCNRCKHVITARRSSQQVPAGVKSFPAFRGLTRTLAALAIAAIPASDLELSRVSQ